jgi:hypothetical protein
MPDLKPCPFCGGKALLWTRRGEKMGCCDDIECPARNVVFTVEEWNTRPTPDTTGKCGELVTVRYEYQHHDPLSGRPVWHDKTHWNGQSPSAARELVPRSQAEELLGAAQADSARLDKALDVAAKMNRLSMDDNIRLADERDAMKDGNAANAARIRELEEKNFEAEAIISERDDRLALVDRIADLIGLPKDQELDQVTFELWLSDLEAKLAAANKALKFYADPSKWDDGYFKSEDDGTVLRAYPSSIENDQGDTARAALGGKP